MAVWIAGLRRWKTYGFLSQEDGGVEGEKSFVKICDNSDICCIFARG